MGYFMLRRTKRHLLVPLAVLLALVAFAAAWVEAGRVDPSRVPQERWYEIGTTSPRVAFTPLPHEHEVIVVPVEQSVAVRLLAVAQQLRGGPGVAERGGKFDAETGRITILSEEARFEAGLPSPLQSHFRHVLRHEYGHALLYDWMVATMGREQAAGFFRATGVGGVPKNGAYPPALRPVIREFQELRQNALYGDAYFTATFDEYVAESYARYLERDGVPARTAGFLRSLSVAR